MAASSLTEQDFNRLFGHCPERESPLLWADQLSTALGPMLALCSKDAVVLLEFYDRRNLQQDLAFLSGNNHGRVGLGNTGLHQQLQTQLDEYFSGRRKQFDIPITMHGSEFQKTVWQGLLDIPFGSTMSYGDLAKRLDRPGAAIAIGGANGKNRLCLLIPCHRVIGSDGSMTGYGAGVEHKKKLLEIEKNYL